MSTLNAPLVLSRLLEHARSLPDTGDWEPFHPGVSAHWLYREDDGGPAAVLLHYEPGSRVTRHEHVGYEHMLVLDGEQYDEDGSYPTGSLVIRPPGTPHSPGSVAGCVVLLVYERAVHFLAS